MRNSTLKRSGTGRVTDLPAAHTFIQKWN